MKSFAGAGWGEEGAVGGRREKPKTDQKIVIRSRVLCNNYLEAFSTQSQVLLASIVEGKEIYFQDFFLFLLLREIFSLTF